MREIKIQIYHIDVYGEKKWMKFHPKPSTNEYSNSLPK